MHLDPRACVNKDGHFILQRVLTFFVGLNDASYMQCLSWSREYPPIDRVSPTVREAVAQLAHYTGLAVETYPTDLVVIRVNLRITQATQAHVAPLVRESVRVRIGNAMRDLESAAALLDAEIRTAATIGENARLYTHNDLLAQLMMRTSRIRDTDKDKDRLWARVVFDTDQHRHARELHVVNAPAFAAQPPPQGAVERVDAHPLGARAGLD